MKRPRGERTHIKVTAYHEAGHALTALHEGRQVRGLFVSPTRPGNGLCLCTARQKNPYRLVINQGSIKVAWRYMLESTSADIRFYMAGPLAEAKALGKPLRSLGSQSDLDKCICLAERLAYISSSDTDYTKIVHVNTDQILQAEKQKIRRWLNRPEIWSAVSLVADMLSVNGRLSGSNLNNIIGRAITPKWQQSLYFGLARRQ